MVHTSILQRLSAPLCDAVLEADNSAELLAQLEQANLFLIALDDHRRWYRYHHLFAQLLRLELAQREPELAPVLHRRAAAWFQDAGDLEATIYHAANAGDFARAAALIARDWLPCARRGQVTTVQRWLGWLPDGFITSNPPIALLAAWVGGLCNISRQEIERRLAAAEASEYQGPLPAGISSVPFGAALVRAVNVFDNVERALQASRRALDAAGASASESHWMAMTALGRNLYLSGQVTEARAVLEDVVSNAPAPDQVPFAVINAFALLSLLAGEDGDDERALGLARQAMNAAEAQGVRHDPMMGSAYIALARSTARRGGLAEAEQLLDLALQVSQGDSFKVQYAQALLELAGVRHARGDTDGTQAAVERARQLIVTCTDPGMLGALLDRTERALSRPRRRRPSTAVSLTDRELVVLRMLPTALSQREIAQEFTVSVNTVRTHMQAIYRKLGVASRQEAIAVAREQGLLPDPAARPRGDSGSARGG
jgi:LuxR family maltose regulon positive regulatory protein